jgi:hypothetical protein
VPAIDRPFDGDNGKQMIPVMGVTSSANRERGIFWRISAVIPPIRSWYVCLCVVRRETGKE